MIWSIFFLTFLVPAMLGLAEIIHFAKVYIMLPRRRASKYLLVFLNDQNTLRQLWCLLEEYKWSGKKYAEKIIAVNMGLDEEDYNKALRVNNKDYLILCRFDELQKVLVGLKI